MQTFLPFPDFKKSAKALDNKRLGKQRVEVLQILNTLKKGNKWANHPAVRMWKGHGCALAKYGNACLDEWKRRGFASNMKPLKGSDSCSMPSWFGRKDVHDSQKARLFQKDPGYYGRFARYAQGYTGYVWPVPIKPSKEIKVKVSYKGERYTFVFGSKGTVKVHPLFKVLR